MSEFIVRAEETDLFFLFKDYKELIRCKDCKHSQGGGYPHCDRVTWWNSENDFCSRAERKE